MRREAEKIIACDSNHPLKFLLDQAGKFRKQRTLKHHELVGRPDIVQMGHIRSDKLRDGERLMLQGAWENQLNSITIESSHKGGAVIEQLAVNIGGIAVDIKTATFWERIGWLKPGTIASASRVELYD